jgi:hypothetical protein
MPPSSAGNLLKRPANKLDGTLHPGAILLRPALPRQFHQRRQLVQAGAQGAWILCHYPPTGMAGEGFSSDAEVTLWKMIRPKARSSASMEGGDADPSLHTWLIT